MRRAYLVAQSLFLAGCITFEEVRLPNSAVEQSALSTEDVRWLADGSVEVEVRVAAGRNDILVRLQADGAPSPLFVGLPQRRLVTIAGDTRPGGARVLALSIPSGNEDTIRVRANSEAAFVAQGTPPATDEFVVDLAWYEQVGDRVEYQSITGIEVRKGKLAVVPAIVVGIGLAVVFQILTTK